MLARVEDTCRLEPQLKHGQYSVSFVRKSHQFTRFFLKCIFLLAVLLVLMKLTKKARHPSLNFKSPYTSANRTV